MDILITTITPCLITFFWAVYSKAKEGRGIDALIIAIVGSIAIVNGVAVFCRIVFDVNSEILHFFQLVISTAIIPLVYMYFSRQVGRAINNETTILLWSLLFFLLIPNFTIFFPGCETTVVATQILPFSVNLFISNDFIYTIHTADCIIFLQALLTLRRMYIMKNMMRTYGLTFNNKMYAFLFWWIFAIIFCLFSSFTTTTMLKETINTWILFTFYSAVLSSIFALLALHFDIHPVVITSDFEVDDDESENEDEDETAEDGGATNNHPNPKKRIIHRTEPVHIDSFVDRSREMAAYVRHIVEKSDEYLNPEMTTETVISALGTNRTYFARMMTAEFGMKFSDFLNQARLSYSAELLKSTDRSISDIALSSGFKDASYFGRRFKEKYGVTPIMWRKDEFA